VRLPSNSTGRKTSVRKKFWYKNKPIGFACSSNLYEVNKINRLTVFRYLVIKKKWQSKPLRDSNRNFFGCNIIFEPSVISSKKVFIPVKSTRVCGSVDTVVECL